MGLIPKLRVAPLHRLRGHEEIDPLRVDRLVARMEGEGTQVNPMVCCEGPDGDLVLLDGATRRAALERLDLTYGVVQVVDPEEVELETWHHVIRRCRPDEVKAAIEASPLLVFDDELVPPRLHTRHGERMGVAPNRVSPNAALSALVASYVGRWKVNRVTDPDPEMVTWRFPDWAAMIEFPPLTVEDVLKAASADDRLPAGITRFVVPDRALRLNVDLSLLRSPGSEPEKQEALDRLLQERARAARIRRYDEPVIILDD